MTNKSLIIASARALVENTLGSEPSGHDFEHVARVVHNAKTIAATYPETEVDYFVVELAAWLHDIDDRKIEYVGNHITVQQFFASVELEHATRIAITNIIETMSFHHQVAGAVVTSLEGQIVQDADRLDAMGFIGVARAFAYGGSKKRPMVETIRHFDEKLFKLVALFNTPKGKELAQIRHTELVQFYQRYLAENIY